MRMRMRSIALGAAVLLSGFALFGLHPPQMSTDADDKVLTYAADPDRAYTDAMTAKEKGDLASFVQLMSMYRALVAGTLAPEVRAKLDTAITEAKSKLRTQRWTTGGGIDIEPRITTSGGVDIMPSRPVEVRIPNAPDVEGGVTLIPRRRYLELLETDVGRDNEIKLLLENMRLRDEINILRKDDR